MTNSISWDEYFVGIAEAVSRKSHCLSHQFGAIAVNNHNIVSTGYNGPPSHYPHCSGLVDPKFTEAGKMCPRHAVGYKSGQGLEICPATHAEANVLINAAKWGISLNGCTLYVTSPVPCRECSKLIVNAGIIEVVVAGVGDYPDIGLSGMEILRICGVKLRFMELHQ